MENNNWHKRFRQMKKDLKLKNKDISAITGNTTESITSGTKPSTPLPRWVKLAIFVHEMHQEKTIENIEDLVIL